MTLLQLRGKVHLVVVVVPAAAEIMDRTCLEVVARHRKTELDPEVNACIVIEIDGDDVFVNTEIRK